MLIISDFKDYYDNMSEVDKSVIYERKTFEYNRKNCDISGVHASELFKDIICSGVWSVLHNKRCSEDKKALAMAASINYVGDDKRKGYSNIGIDNISPVVIGFCGEVHVAWKTVKFNNNQQHEIKYVYDNNIVKYLKVGGYFYGKDKVSITSIINNIKKIDFTDICREYRSPVFLLDYDTVSSKHYGYSTTNKSLVINPQLKDIEFYKVYDSYSCKQLIENYLSGVLGGVENDNIKLSNESVILKHGFDLKTSFRKM